MASMTTTKSIEDVSPCIVQAWTELSTALASYDVRTLPRPNKGQTVLLGNPSNSTPVAFVDLERTEPNNQTKVNYYVQKTLSIGNFFKTQEMIVRACL